MSPRSATPLRVAIADDHPFYRERLARLLHESADVVAKVPNGEAAIRAVEENAPDAVVMDLNMPGLSGLEATRRVTERAPATRIVVLTVSAQEADVADAILAGAHGYVLKDGPMDEVVGSIRAAVRGQSLISPRIATVLLERAAGAPADRTRRLLTGRDLEVLRLVAEGKAEHEIAETLAVDAGTLRTLVSEALVKLQLESRVHAAARGPGGHDRQRRRAGRWIARARSNP